MNSNYTQRNGDPSRVVITGLGMITAAGHTPEATWNALGEGKPLFSSIEHFEPGPSEPTVAAQVTDFTPREWLPFPIVRQTDRSTHFAFAAVRKAMKDANLDLEHVDPLRVGVVVGHALGGMDYAEQQLYNQKVFGPEEVGPYQSIAWFYAAAMGQLSIVLGLRGYSKAAVAGRASGLHAIGHAYRAIQSGRCDMCLAGGIEAPLSPFMYRILAGTGQLGTSDYKPFAKDSSGFIVGEGACFMVLESAESAKKRGVEVHAEIGGFGMTTDATAGPHALSGSAEMRRAIDLASAGRNGVTPDLVIADAVANTDGDASEVNALTGIHNGNNGKLPPISVPKSIVGEMYGAGGGLQVATAVQSLKSQEARAIATPGSGNGSYSLTNNKELAIENVLINNRARGGVNASLLVSRAAL